MSLRMRLIISYTLIIILCLSIAAVAMSAVIQGYRDQIVKARLDDVARPVYVQLRSLAQGEASSTEVWANLKGQAQKDDVYTVVKRNVNGTLKRFIEVMSDERVRLITDGRFLDSYLEYTGGNDSSLISVSPSCKSPVIVSPSISTYSLSSAVMISAHVILSFAPPVSS